MRFSARVVLAIGPLLLPAARITAQDVESAAAAAEEAGRLSAALELYLAALGALTDPPPVAADMRLRERVIRVVRRMDTVPPVPEHAVRFVTRGTVAFKEARNAEELRKALAEYRQAVKAAPWHVPGAFNMAIVQEKLGEYDAALSNLKLALLASASGPATEQIRVKLYEVEYKNEQRAQRLKKYESGEVPREAAAALALYEEACEAGMPGSCAALVRAAMNLEESARKVELYEKACDHGGVWGCYELARHFEYRGEQAGAQAYYQRACLLGGTTMAAYSCFLVASFYEDVKKDAERAREYYAKGCALDHTESCRKAEAARR